MDREIEDYLVNAELDLTDFNDETKAYGDAEIIVIATPTNYDSKLNFFDTSSVEHVLDVMSSLPIDIMQKLRMCWRKAIRETCITGIEEK